MYEDAMEWLDELHALAELNKNVRDQKLIEWIQDKLYFDNDMRNS